MNRFLIIFFVMANTLGGFSQSQPSEKHIEIVYGGTLTIDQQKYPDATIFSSDQRQVQFRHQGVDIWCDLAIFYQNKNQVYAHGNVFLQQGDSLKMNSNYLSYDGNSRLAVAKENVELRNEKMKLQTEALFFDRNTQVAYYNESGTITNEENVLTSKEGKYFVALNKNQFDTQVHLQNPDFTLNSERLDYYHNSKHAYLYGPSHIQGKGYDIYCESGFYDTQNEQGNFRKNAKINYNLKTLEGDSLYFDNRRSFASASNHIRITDTINKVIVTGDYGEVFKEKDSMFITRRALLIGLFEKDSSYLHAKKIMITGKEKERVIYAYPDARIYKKDLQGKCDSIHSSEITGLTQLIGKPILWSGESQITGDSIHLISNVKTEKLDSLKVIGNTFIIEKDTLGEGFNQVKAKLLLGKFENNTLKNINLYQNTETIYYAYSENNELIGINKLICSQIRLILNPKQQIESISFYVNPSGELYPDDKLEKSLRILPGFLWRGDERIRSREDLFSQEEKELTPIPINAAKTREEIDILEQSSPVNPEEDPQKTHQNKPNN